MNQYETSRVKHYLEQPDIYIVKYCNSIVHGHDDLLMQFAHGMTTWDEVDSTWIGIYRRINNWRMGGTPLENGMKFCPYCGEELKEKEWEDG